MDGARANCLDLMALREVCFEISHQQFIVVLRGRPQGGRAAFILDGFGDGRIGLAVVVIGNFGYSSSIP